MNNSYMIDSYVIHDYYKNYFRFFFVSISLIRRPKLDLKSIKTINEQAQTRS